MYKNKDYFFDITINTLSPEQEKDLVILSNINKYLSNLEPDYGPLNQSQYDTIWHCLDLKNKIDKIQDERIKSQNKINHCIKKIKPLLIK